jgi:hypothetical protein
MQADFSNNIVRRVVLSTSSVTSIGGLNGGGLVDGVGTVVSFHNPQGVALDAAGAVALVVRVIVGVTACTPSSAYSTVLFALRLLPPSGRQADTFSYAIRRINMSSGETTTLAGRPGVQGRVDGPFTSATFTNSVGVAVDALGLNAFVVGERLV